MKVLSVSDKVEESLYAPTIRKRYPDVDLILGCGDLPYYYLEYIQDALNKPVYFVRGNHANPIEYGASGSRRGPQGAMDLHRKVVSFSGVCLAGVEGSLRYNRGAFQYTQDEMWGHVLSLAPGMLRNKLSHGRYLDIFISHAPPAGIHDQPDRAHQGIRAFRWLLKSFKPRYHFHGHVHIYTPDTVRQTEFVQTTVINTYGHRITDI